MRKPDIFDEMILCLRESANVRPDADVAPKILDEFMRPAKRERKAAEVVKTPAKTLSVPQSPAAGEGAKTFSKVDCSNASWAELEEAVRNCRACNLCSTRKNTVLEDGSRTAKLMFIGEGPGADEDATGVPFVGMAGQLLSKMIAAMQFDRKTEVYIANIVKCRPPGNRVPEEDEAKVCLPYLVRQIELVKPEVIVLLGATALLFLLNRKRITECHGEWMEFMGIKVMPTFHPAFLLRNANKKADTWKDLQKVMAYFGKTPVQRQH